jgi:hypothetical protein
MKGNTIGYKPLSLRESLNKIVEKASVFIQTVLAKK